MIYAKHTRNAQKSLILKLDVVENPAYMGEKVKDSSLERCKISSLIF